MKPQSIWKVPSFNFRQSVMYPPPPATRVINWFNLDRNIPLMTTDLHLRKKLTNLYIYSIDFYGAETWTFRKVDQKCLENIKIWCCRRKVTISPTEELHRNKEERNILHAIKRGKSNWIGHILRRIFLVKQVIEGKVEVKRELMGRLWVRHKQLVDDIKERRKYWKWTGEVQARPLCGTCLTAAVALI
jgi:hypothetical protein